MSGAYAPFNKMTSHSMSNFKIGDWIRFRYTGERAKIIENCMDGNYEVWLESDDESTSAFVDDIVHEADFKGVEQPKLFSPKKTKEPSTEEMFYSKKKLNRKSKQKWKKPSKNLKKTNNPKTSKRDRPKPVFQAPKIKETATTGTGLFVAFLSSKFSEYTVYLVNDTMHSFSFEFILYLNNKEHYKLKNHMTLRDFFSIATLERAQLNDHPIIELRVPVLGLFKRQKVRCKKFLRDGEKVPLMGIEGYLFAFPLLQKAREIENLKTYTKQQMQQQLPRRRKLKSHYNISAFVEFDTDLDLHIEKLVQNPKKILPSRILSTQLEHFEDYINRAIRLGIRQVCIIHGVGDGKLKDIIHLRLKDLKRQGEVDSYHNDYHYKYKFGATVIYFNQWN